MTAVQQSASLHERSVQEVATGEVEPQPRKRRSRPAPPEARSSSVTTKSLPPLLKLVVKARGADISQVEFLDDGGIIIHANSDWKRLKK